MGGLKFGNGGGGDGDGILNENEEEKSFVRTQDDKEEIDEDGVVIRKYELFSLCLVFVKWAS